VAHCNGHTTFRAGLVVCVLELGGRTHARISRRPNVSFHSVGGPTLELRCVLAAYAHVNLGAMRAVPRSVCIVSDIPLSSERAWRLASLRASRDLTIIQVTGASHVYLNLPTLIPGPTPAVRLPRAPSSMTKDDITGPTRLQVSSLTSFIVLAAVLAHMGKWVGASISLGLATSSALVHSPATSFKGDEWYKTVDYAMILLFGVYGCAHVRCFIGPPGLSRVLAAMCLISALEHVRVIWPPRSHLRDAAHAAIHTVAAAMVGSMVGIR